VHLILAASSPDANSRAGEHHQIYCKPGQAKNAKKANKSDTAQEDAPGSLYKPGIKIGGPCQTMTTCGGKDKSMPCKTETYKRCPFQFTFKWMATAGP
jgi:hypothetical protein